MTIITVKSKKYRICKTTASTMHSRGNATEFLHNWAYLQLEDRGIERPSSRHYRVRHNEDTHTVYIEGAAVFWTDVDTDVEDQPFHQPDYAEISTILAGFGVESRETS